MEPVRSRNAPISWSSITMVLEVLAPEMPSLKAPVILELIFRTFRFQWRIRGWNQPVRAAMAGTTRITTRASCQFRASMAANTPTTYSSAQAMSVRFQAMFPAMRLVSFITRVMR